MFKSLFLLLVICILSSCVAVNKNPYIIEIKPPEEKSCLEKYAAVEEAFCTEEMNHYLQHRRCIIKKRGRHTLGLEYCLVQETLNKEQKDKWLALFTLIIEDDFTREGIIYQIDPINDMVIVTTIYLEDDIYKYIHRGWINKLDRILYYLNHFPIPSIPFPPDSESSPRKLTKEELEKYYLIATGK